MKAHQTSACGAQANGRAWPRMELPIARLRLTSVPVMKVTPRRTPLIEWSAVFWMPIAATAGNTAAEDGQPRSTIIMAPERQMASRAMTAGVPQGRLISERRLPIVAATTKDATSAAACWKAPHSCSLALIPRVMLAPLMKEAKKPPSSRKPTASTNPATAVSTRPVPRSSEEGVFMRHLARAVPLRRDAPLGQLCFDLRGAGRHGCREPAGRDLAGLTGRNHAGQAQSSRHVRALAEPAYARDPQGFEISSRRERAAPISIQKEPCRNGRPSSPDRQPQIGYGQSSQSLSNARLSGR